MLQPQRDLSSRGAGLSAAHGRVLWRTCRNCVLRAVAGAVRETTWTHAGNSSARRFHARRPEGHTHSEEVWAAGGGYLGREAATTKAHARRQRAEETSARIR